MARRNVVRVRAEKRHVAVFVCPRCGREFVDGDVAKAVTYGARHLKACVR